MNLSEIYVLNIKGADYRCVISGIIKSEVINLMQNIDLTEKYETLQKFYCKFWFKRKKSKIKNENK